MKEKNFLYLLVSVSRQIRNLVKHKTVRLPLTFEQIRAISYIRRFEGLSLTTLTEYLETNPMSASKIIKVLGRDGWVIKKVDSSDRRAYNLFLTKKGHEMCQSLEPIIQEVFLSITKHLSLEEIETLEHLLKKIKLNTDSYDEI